MKTLSLILLLSTIFALQSCYDDFWKNDSYGYLLNPDAQIQLYYDTIDVDFSPDIINLQPVPCFSIVDGTKLVAMFQFSAYQSDHIADDEYSYLISFEIDPEATEFYFEDSALTSINCYFQESGAWVRHNTHIVKNGSISGSLAGPEEWYISFNITTTPVFSDEEPQSFSGNGLFTFGEE